MLQNNTIVKILSLIIAISLWGYVVWTENPVISQQFDGIPVQVRNLSSLEERGLVLLGEQEYRVNVKLQGKKKDIGTITANDITATVDIGGFGEGETTVAVDVHTLDNASVVEVKPNKITFNIDTIITAEKSVSIGASGSVPENTEMGVPVSSVETVTLRGASSLVNSVSKVSANVDMLKLTDEETVQATRLIPQNSRGEEVYGVTVTPSTTDLTSILYYTKTVSLNTEVRGEAAEGYDVSHVTVPDTITIRGSQDAINSVREVNGFVNVNDMTSSGRVPVSISLPSGVALSSENPNVMATVSIENLSSEETGNPDIDDDESTESEAGGGQENESAE